MTLVSPPGGWQQYYSSLRVSLMTFKTTSNQKKKNHPTDYLTFDTRPSCTKLQHRLHLAANDNVDTRWQHPLVSFMPHKAGEKEKIPATFSALEINLGLLLQCCKKYMNLETLTLTKEFLTL